MDTPQDTPEVLTALINVLVEKGVITEQEKKRLHEKVARPFRSRQSGVCSPGAHRKKLK